VSSDSTPPGVTTITNPPIESHEHYIFLPLVLRGYPNLVSVQSTATTASAWDSGDIPPGEQYALVFPATGIFEYHCAYHPTETGQVLVELAPFDFALAVAPTAQSVRQGESITYTVRVTGTLGDAEPVALSVGGLPAGATYDLSPVTVVPTGTAALSVTTALTTPLGDHTLVITGTSVGQSHAVTTILSVTPHPDFTLSAVPATRNIPQGQAVTYTVQVTASHGFDAPVSLAVEGLPAGAAVTWAQNPLTPTAVTLLTVSTGLDTPTDSHPLIVTADGGGFSHQALVTLEVMPHPDFALEATSETYSVRQSQAVTATVILTALHGFDSSVALNVGSLPAGVTSDWVTNPVAPDGSTLLAFTTALTTPLGDHGLVITGTGGGFTHTDSFTLTVLPHPDFAFAVAPLTQAITQGLAVTFTAHLTAEHDWEGPVQLSIQGLPTDATALWAPDLVTPTATSLLTLTTAQTTPPGVYPLTAAGGGGLLSHTVPLTLTVLAPPVPDLIVERLTCDPITPTVNVPFTVAVRVRNLGGISVTQTFRVDWYADPATPPLTNTPGTGYWLQAGLAPGAAADFTATHTFTVTGNHALWAQVDRTEVVTESDEANNLTGPVTVTVGLPDLLVSSIAITPPVPTEGISFTVSLAVVNQGVVDTVETFQVDWYADLSTAPLSTTVGTLFWTQQGMAMGTTAVLTTSRTFDQVGIRRLWAQVDRLDQVAESDEGNNVTGPSLSFVDRAVPSPTPLWTPTPQPAPSPTPATGPISSTVTVQSDITADTTWTADNLYVVVGRVTVDAGVTLTIEPGTVVKFQQQTYKGKLTVNGVLLAQGTADDRIIFTSIQDDAGGGDTNTNGGATWPWAGDWDGLVFGSTGSGTLEYVWLGYGGADGNVTANGATVNLRHAFVGYSASSGLRWMNGAGGEISDSVIEQNLGIVSNH